MKRRGFTLIELLVVIAIIAILAAILFPIFANAKERARQVKCCSNLKQLTMAFFSYADDHDGYLPIGSRRYFSTQLSQQDDIEWTGTQWYSWSTTDPPPIDVKQGSLYKCGYARSVEMFQCPTDRNLPAWSSGKKIAWPANTTVGIPNGFGLSYSLNKELCFKNVTSSTYTTIKLSVATAGRASQILFLIHETRGNATHYGINDGYFSYGANGTGDLHDKIHYNGTTCSYSDGHVKWLGNNEMQKCEDNSTKSPWFRNAHYYAQPNDNPTWQYRD